MMAVTVDNIQKLKFNSVLIVDDDELDLWITEKLLLTGADVEYFYKEQNALNALTLIKSIQDIKEIPELILLDIKMPVMNGLTFLEKFNNLSKDVRKTCKIILMSAYFNFMEDPIEEAKKHPSVVGYIEKPLDPSQLHSFGL